MVYSGLQGIKSNVSLYGAALMGIGVNAVVTQKMKKKMVTDSKTKGMSKKNNEGKE
jgi:hypothetical protein